MCYPDIMIVHAHPWHLSAIQTSQNNNNIEHSNMIHFGKHNERNCCYNGIQAHQFVKIAQFFPALINIYLIIQASLISQDHPCI